MLTMNLAKVDHKCYRLCYLLNKKLKLTTRMGTGTTTDPMEVAGVLGQGTIGASLVSQLNIDNGVNSFFCGSGYEALYGSVCLQPLQTECKRRGNRQSQNGENYGWYLRAPVSLS